jgi:hypothetical protein
MKANSSGEVNVTWENEEQTIIRFEFKGHWTWLQAHNTRLQSNKMIDSTLRTKPIGAIFLPSGTYMPPNTLSNAKKEILARHPRIVVIALVSDNTVVRTLFNAIIRLAPSLRPVYHFVPSLGAAHILINRELNAHTTNSGASVG